MSNMSRVGPDGSDPKRSPPGRPTSAWHFAAPLRYPTRRGGSHRHPGRGPRRLLRAVRHRSGPRDPRPEGEDRGRDRAGIAQLRVPRQHGGVRRPRPPQGHQLGHAPRAESMRLLAEGKIDAFLGFPPEPAGAAGEEDRPRRRQQRARPAVVPVFLLHAGRQPGVRPEAPGRHEAGAAGDPERRPTSARRAGAGRSTARRQGLHDNYDYALQTSRSSPTASGASTTPRTRCASTRCACTRPG